ncbi:MAG: acetyl-CoA carboxylase biotin carboxyl carrier protein [Candidatus Gastranaerophilales bacterium]|nr:acetyl-CoA carboxylase biotin carboxyl carrier protein [Candidatus Gastranaerophilales bacterium]
MKFDLEYIKKLAEIVKCNELTEITLEDGEKAITVRKEQEIIAAAPAVAQPTVPAIQQTASAKVEVPSKEEKTVSKGTPIISPMVGTFYASPSPGSEPFVKVGQIVNQGQTVCILEAMKLMNEIEAEVSGKIIEICVKDGDPIEFAQVLMYVE